jgi:hypothetical protein
MSSLILLFSRNLSYQNLKRRGQSFEIPCLFKLIRLNENMIEDSRLNLNKFIDGIKLKNNI